MEKRAGKEDIERIFREIGKKHGFRQVDIEISNDKSMCNIEWNCLGINVAFTLPAFLLDAKEKMIEEMAESCCRLVLGIERSPLSDETRGVVHEKVSEAV